MLSRIQALLVGLYDLPPLADVTCFVCGPEMLHQLAGEGAAERREVLLVAEDEEGVHVALYLDPEVLEDLRTDEPRFDAMQLATEGVSHFVYLSFREQNEEAVSQLELELQAEVDKYAAGLLAGNGVGAIRARSRALRQKLYADAKFLDAEHTEEGERYRLAHRAAARYAARLEARYVDVGRLEELFIELRQFYRLGVRQKLVRAHH